LMQSCIHGFGSITAALLKAGACANAQDPDGYTALHLACERGLHTCVEALVAQDGIDLELCNQFSENAVRLACASGQDAVLRQLLEAGATASGADDTGYTPLLVACREGHVECVRALLGRSDVDVESRDSYRHTALILAASHETSQLDMVAILLEAGADMECKTHWGSWTALMCACWQGHDAIALLLMDKGADVTQRMGGGETTLSMAAKHCGRAVVHAMLRKGGDALRRTVTDIGNEDVRKVLLTFSRLHKWRQLVRVMPYVRTWIEEYATARFGPRSAYTAYQANLLSGGDPLERTCLALRVENEQLIRCLKRTRDGQAQASLCRGMADHILGMGAEESARVWRE
jgi:ankyrin repeat protein